MQLEQDRVAELEQVVTQMMIDYQVPGLAISVGSGTEVVYTQGFGCSCLAMSTPTDEHTVFGIGSVTKSFTALAIMLLAERGLLALNDPVSRYLPEFRLAGTNADQVTIHHLLTHTSGLPPTPAMEYAMATWLGGEAAKGKPSVATSDELLRFLAGGDVIALGAPG